MKSPATNVFAVEHNWRSQGKIEQNKQVFGSEWHKTAGYGRCSVRFRAEVKPMRICLPIISLAAFLWTPAAHAQTDANDFYRQWVDYRNGAVSLAFDQTPIPFAISALHATTGFQIIVPSVSDIKVVNLKLHQQPLEPAVRSLISSIGYKNFAMMYDENGQPNRAVVLGARPQVDERTTVAKTEPITLPLLSEEREKLQKDLERWGDLKQEERGRIEERLKNLPESDERDQLIKLYGTQILASTK